jgi:hypothetical protein
MKKLFYSASIGSIMLLLAVLVQSCKQDVAVQPTPTVDNVTTPVGTVSSVKLTNVEVIDGRLVFKSQDELKAAYAKMSKNQADLGRFEAQFKGYTSQKQAFENFSSADLDRTNGDLTPFQDYVVKNVTKGEASYDEVVAPKIYSHLINAEGLLQIGEKVYKFVPNFIYEFNVSEMAAYKANKNNLGAIPNVQIADFKVRKQPIQATNREDGFASSQKTEIYTTKNGTRKVDAYLSTSEPCCFIAWTSDVILKHQVSSRWGWTNERTELKFDGIVHYGVIQYSGERTRASDSPRRAYSFEPNNSKASLQLDWNYSGFQYVYFAPTNVTYTTIKQPGNLPYTYSILNISF